MDLPAPVGMTPSTSRPFNSALSPVGTIHSRNTVAALPVRGCPMFVHAVVHTLIYAVVHIAQCNNERYFRGAVTWP